MEYNRFFKIVGDVATHHCFDPLEVIGAEICIEPGARDYPLEKLYLHLRRGSKICVCMTHRDDISLAPLLEPIMEAINYVQTSDLYNEKYMEDFYKIKTLKVRIANDQIPKK